MTTTIGGLSAGGSRSITVTANTLTFGGAIGTSVTNGGVTKAGAGTLVFSGDNTYTGTTSVNVGALNIQHANALGTTDGGTSVANGATLQLQGGVTFGAEALSLASGNSSNAMLQNVSGSNEWTGTIGTTGTGATARISSELGTLTVSNTISSSGTQFVLQGASAITVTGQITGNSTFTLGTTGSGSGSIRTFSNTSNNYTGATTVTGGTLVGTGATVFGSTTSISVGAVGTLSLRGDSSIGFVKASDSSAIALTTSASGATFNVDQATVAGTTAKTMSAGTLVVNGDQSAAIGNVSVTGTLAGNGGIVGGNTTISAGGKLAMGDGTANSIGTGTFNGTLAFAATSIFDWDLNAPTTDQAGADQGNYDKVVNNNATKMSGTSVFNVILGTGDSFTDAFWDTNKTWTNVFSGTGVATDLSAIFTSFSGAGIVDTGGVGVVAGRGEFTFNGSTSLTWTAVPEPSTALVGLLIGAGLLRRRRNVEC